MIYVIHWFVNILTLGLVSIATITTTTYHVDDPITELNNQSLNDVFLDGNLIVNGDFNDGLNNVNYSFPTNNTYVLNGIFYSQANAINQALYYDITPVIGNKYYQVASIKSQLLSYAYRNYSIIGNPYVYATDYDNFELITIYGEVDHDGTNEIQIRQLNNNLTGNYLEVDYYYIYDLTVLGIDNLTQAQMDDWYDIFVQANENNGIYIDSTAHLNNNIHLVDVSVMVISFAFWVWLTKFLKGVIL